jgi:hypothetical protein
LFVVSCSHQRLRGKILPANRHFAESRALDSRQTCVVSQGQLSAKYDADGFGWGAVTMRFAVRLMAS